MQSQFERLLGLLIRFWFRKRLVCDRPADCCLAHEDVVDCSIRDSFLFQFSDLLADDHVAARTGITTLADSDVRVYANPLRFDGARGDAGSQALAPPPDLGAHTDELLTEAGFTVEEIEALRAQRVI